MRLLVTLLILSGIVWCQERDPRLVDAIRRVDALSADSEQKPVVAAAISERLGIHRNRLSLLRQQTGETYAQIMVSRLRAGGSTDAQIIEQLRGVETDVVKRMAAYRAERYEGGDPGSEVRPLALLTTSADFNTAGTFYSVVPLVGVAWRGAYIAAGAPYYHTSSDSLTATGMGDAFVTAGVTGDAGRANLGFALTTGAPTGDRDLGLGAGKVTVDGTFSAGSRFAWGRVFGNVGLANSMFSNAAYQRPYISNGSAAHFSAAVEFTPVRWLTIGGGGFAVRPFGTQTVYSRVIEETVPVEQGMIGVIIPPAANPMGRGPGNSGKPVFETVTRTEVESVSLRDHGPNAWAAVNLTRYLTLDLAVARSVPFKLTAASVGMTFNIVRAFSSARN